MLGFFQTSNYSSTLIYHPAGQEQITGKLESAWLEKNLLKAQAFLISHVRQLQTQQSEQQGNMISQTSPDRSRGFWGLWSLCLRKTCRAVLGPAFLTAAFLSSPRLALFLRFHLCLKEFICECSFSGFLLGSFYCASSFLVIARQRVGF